MNLLAKIALLILTAKVLAGTPRGTNKDIDAIGDFSLRDIAHGISVAATKVEEAVVGLWTEPVRPKVAFRRPAGVHRPADSF